MKMHNILKVSKYISFVVFGIVALWVGQSLMNKGWIKTTDGKKLHETNGHFPTD